MKISEIFWLAANEHLDYWDCFSCGAIRFAVYRAAKTDVTKTLDKAYCFVERLGCNTFDSSQFIEFKPGPERQGARYAWLMFASMYAEELGL